jgi:hypothetical protein
VSVDYQANSLLKNVANEGLGQWAVEAQPFTQRYAGEYGMRALAPVTRVPGQETKLILVTGAFLGLLPASVSTDIHDAKLPLAAMACAKQFFKRFGAPTVAETRPQAELTAGNMAGLGLGQ